MSQLIKNIFYFAEWSERVKQINKIWKKLTPSQKNPYLVNIQHVFCFGGFGGGGGGVLSFFFFLFIKIEDVNEQYFNNFQVLFLVTCLCSLL